MMNSSKHVIRLSEEWSLYCVSVGWLFAHHCDNGDICGPGVENFNGTCWRCKEQIPKELVQIGKDVVLLIEPNNIQFYR